MFVVEVLTWFTAYCLVKDFGQLSKLHSVGAWYALLIGVFMFD